MGFIDRRREVLGYDVGRHDVLRVVSGAGPEPRRPEVKVCVMSSSTNAPAEDICELVARRRFCFLSKWILPYFVACSSLGLLETSLSSSLRGDCGCNYRSLGDRPAIGQRSLIDTSFEPQRLAFVFAAPRLRLWCLSTASPR